MAAYGAILFSDIGNRIMLYDPATGKTAFFRGERQLNGLASTGEGRVTARALARAATVKSRSQRYPVKIPAISLKASGDW